MALAKSTYDYSMNGDPTVSTTKSKETTTEESKQEIYVESAYEPGVQIYYITIKVKGKTEGKYCYDYENKYVFRTNKALTKLSCINCDDGKFLDIATENAMEHMTKLRRIRKTRWSMFHIFMNGKEIEE